MINEYVDPLVPLVSLNKLPSITTKYPTYQSTPSLNLIEAKSEKDKLSPASVQDLGIFGTIMMLASMDRTFPILVQHWSSPMYVVISDRGSGWVEYVQGLRANAIGYGMADRRGTDFNYRRIATNADVFNPFYGRDSLGDVNVYYKDFANYILRGIGQRITVMFSDSLRADPRIVALIAVKVLGPASSLVIRLNEIDRGLIYLLSSMFKEVTLFRPLLQEVYLLCLSYAGNTEAQLLLEKGVDVVSYDETFNSWIETAIRGVNSHVDARLDEGNIRQELEM